MCEEQFMWQDVHLGDKWSIPTDVQGEAYNQKLKAVLAETVEWKQLADMWELATRRKPLLKLRQTRGRTLQVTTKDEGLSYLDHHPGNHPSYVPHSFHMHARLTHEYQTAIRS